MSEKLTLTLRLIIDGVYSEHSLVKTVNITVKCQMLRSKGGYGDFAV